jgi:hypothetical protein
MRIPYCWADLIRKTRVAGCDREQLLIGGVRADAREEDADLELPPLQVGAQQRGRVRVSQLGGSETLRAPANPQLVAARAALPPFGLVRPAAPGRGPPGRLRQLRCDQMTEFVGL